MIKNVFFDMDGTLLPMETKTFEKLYFKSLAARLAPLGYNPTELIDGVWAGTVAMIRNDGSRLNSEAFWQTFSKIFGQRVYDDIASFDEYYRTDFVCAKQSCGFNAKASETVKMLKAKGCRLVLATNPLFPLVAQQQRIEWAGVSTEAFEHITHYENSHFCKPNPKYYEEILASLGMKAEECLMIGNDVNEDMVAEKLGFKVFLLTDCLINPDGKDISVYPHGNFDDLNKFLLSIV